MKWLNEVVLETDNVQLIPLRLEHRNDLLAAATDGNLWELWFTSVPSEVNIDAYLSKALSDFENDTALPFTVIDKRTNSIIGTTRFANVVNEHRRVEIGYTWYAASYQKTYVNSECKLLLLQYAFEELKAIAVEFRTNWYNFSSRNAIARLGAKQDGVLRNHQFMPDGSYRDTVVFSIIESEWNACKTSLLYKIAQIHQRNKNS
ncbi:GNAT family N-acetyltransferase [Niabella hibiscisoli]|uniref:GNAT family N-acetyltransferase n=1 Tax=Niabella hibiscisoli TaxID=1825928 RepID=UPI001F0F16BB|nr:GNAT family protein [Niabella hibiscisoli]MCH5718633.1 GNAT family N-acetyltransferase [Niabella hibiscisoli]